MPENKTNSDSISIFGTYLVAAVMILMLAADHIGHLPEATSEVITAIAVILAVVALVALVKLSADARKQEKVLGTKLLGDAQLLKDAGVWLWEHPILTVILVGIGIAITRYASGGEVNADAAQAVAAGLAVVALMIALVQLSDARQQAKNLRKFYETTTTHNVGIFPDFMSEIIGLIENSNPGGSIKILCDHPGYGIFSRKDLFEEYEQIIRQKRGEGVEVQLVCLHKVRRMELHKEQFDEDSWKTRKREPKTKKYIRDFYDNRVTIAELSHRKFLDDLEARHRDVLTDLFYGANSTTKDLMPLYFWIRDDEEAFSAIASLTQEAWEVGFLTRDRSLIGALIAIFKRYQDTSQSIQ